jgi:hypothetical protein
MASFGTFATTATEPTPAAATVRTMSASPNIALPDQALDTEVNDVVMELTHFDDAYNGMSSRHPSAMSDGSEDFKRKFGDQE